MSSLAISSSSSQALPAVNFRPHGHKKGTQVDTDGNSGSSTTAAQIPVGVGQGLFGNLLHTLEQAVGVQTSSPATAATATNATTGTSGTSTAAGAATGTSPTTTTGTPAVVQDVNSFLHSLFQALKQDGAGSAGAASASAGSSATPAVAGAGQYQGSLASSLQTLIQQVGSNGSASPAVAKLEASFNNLVQGLNGNTASTVSATAAGSTSSQSSSTGLQTFLNNLLQNFQSNGLQAPKLAGSNVNASV